MSGSSSALRTTPWVHTVTAQASRFLRAEVSSSVVLIVAIVIALVWGSVDFSGYQALWSTPLGVHLGGWGVTASVRVWISGGLMALFFLVVGLEARRELDLGSLRDKKQFALPMIAGLAGMAIPVLIFLLADHSAGTRGGWGVAMSTDTALALGLLSVVSRNVPDRVKGFLLTLFIVDDLASLVVIALVYSTDVHLMPVVISALLFVAGLVVRRWSPLRGVSPFFGVASWAAMFVSGIDPLVVGLALGLATRAYVPGRSDLESAAAVFRQFREQPTPQLARSATTSVRDTLSRNEQLQATVGPWATYVIVPLFALSNAGLPLSGAFLRSAFAAPLTLAIVAAYVIGKPIAVIGATWIATFMSRGRLRPPVGWAAVAGTGTIAGVGFTVSVLVAGLAFNGVQLQEAKLGVLTAIVVSSLITAIVYRVTALLPAQRRARALLGRSQPLVDLKVPVDPARDHIRGAHHAAVTIVEYGDFQCPYCGRAETAVREVIGDDDVRFVWRHLPIREVHPHAQLAAEAAEAAAEQDAFWEMHDILLSHQTALHREHLVAYATELRLDVTRFTADLDQKRYAARIEEDLQSGDVSGVTGTPTFFVNGRRHYGAYDAETLRAAVVAAKTSSLLAR